MYSARKESCGKRIAKALSAREMKQSELCKLTNIPKSSLSLYLSDAYEPKGDRIYLIAKVLNVSEAWLMGYDVPMEKNKKTEPTAQDDKLSDNKKQLIDFVKTVPEEKVDLLLKVMKSIVEDD